MLYQNFEGEFTGPGHRSDTLECHLEKKGV